MHIFNYNTDFVPQFFFYFCSLLSTIYYFTFSILPLIYYLILDIIGKKANEIVWLWLTGVSGLFSSIINLLESVFMWLSYCPLEHILKWFWVVCGVCSAGN